MCTDGCIYICLYMCISIYICNYKNQNQLNSLSAKFQVWILTAYSPWSLRHSCNFYFYCCPFTAFSLFFGFFFFFGFYFLLVLFLVCKWKTGSKVLRAIDSVPKPSVDLLPLLGVSESFFPKEIHKILSA